MSRSDEQPRWSCRAPAGPVALALAVLAATACSASPVPSPPASSAVAPTTQASAPYPSPAALPTYEAPVPAPTSDAAATTEQVVSDTYTYKVTGKNRGSITYSSTGGNTSQVTSARLPWSKSVDSPGYGGMTFAYVSAQNSGGGTISCQIIGPGGGVISENTSEGSYAIVTCQA